MRKLILFTLFILAPTLSVRAQTGAVPGFCVTGASQALTSGQKSSNFQQGVIPYCTVKVYLTGTTNLATIYSDISSTPLSNPFTANSSGQWLFFASISQGYDVLLSGGIVPNTYLTPLSITGLLPVGVDGSYCLISGCVLTGPLTSPNINNVYQVDGTRYPDVAAARDACLTAAAAFPSNASPGCVIDARGSGLITGGQAQGTTIFSSPNGITGVTITVPGIYPRGVCPPIRFQSVDGNGSGAAGYCTLNGSNGVASVTMTNTGGGGLATIAVAAGGTGWSLNDTYTIAGGIGGIGVITAISGAGPTGPATAVSIIVNGSSYAATTGAATTPLVSASGAGLTVTTTVTATAYDQPALIFFGTPADYLGAADPVRNCTGTTPTQYCQTIPLTINFGPYWDYQANGSSTLESGTQFIGTSARGISAQNSGTVISQSPLSNAPVIDMSQNNKQIASNTFLSNLTFSGATGNTSGDGADIECVNPTQSGMYYAYWLNVTFVGFYGDSIHLACSPNAGGTSAIQFSTFSNVNVTRPAGAGYALYIGGSVGNNQWIGGTYDSVPVNDTTGPDGAVDVYIGTTAGGNYAAYTQSFYGVTIQGGSVLVNLNGTSGIKFYSVHHEGSVTTNGYLVTHTVSNTTNVNDIIDGAQFIQIGGGNVGAGNGGVFNVTSASGASIGGTTGTLILTPSNNGCSGGSVTATIVNSGSWTGATFAVTNPGTSCTAPPTTATCANGTGGVTCTGSATIASILNGYLFNTINSGSASSGVVTHSSWSSPANVLIGPANPPPSGNSPSWIFNDNIANNIPVTSGATVQLTAAATIDPNVNKYVEVCGSTTISTITSDLMPGETLTTRACSTSGGATFTSVGGNLSMCGGSITTFKLPSGQTAQWGYDDYLGSGILYLQNSSYLMCNAQIGTSQEITGVQGSTGTSLLAYSGSAPGVGDIATYDSSGNAHDSGTPLGGFLLTNARITNASPVTTTATGTSGNNFFTTATSLGATISVGEPVTGSNVASPTFVTSVVGTTVNLSANLTGNLSSTSVTFSFANTGSTSGTQVYSLAIPANTVTSSGTINVTIATSACTGSTTPFSSCTGINTGTCLVDASLGPSATGFTFVFIATPGMTAAKSSLTLASIQMQGSQSAEMANESTWYSSVAFTPASPVFGTVPMSNISYLNIKLTNSSSSDTCFLTQVNVQVQP